MARYQKIDEIVNNLYDSNQSNIQDSKAEVEILNKPRRYNFAKIAATGLLFWAMSSFMPNYNKNDVKIVTPSYSTVEAAEAVENASPQIAFRERSRKDSDNLERKVLKRKHSKSKGKVGERVVLPRYIPYREYHSEESLPDREKILYDLINFDSNSVAKIFDEKDLQGKSITTAELKRGCGKEGHDKDCMNNEITEKTNAGEYKGSIEVQIKDNGAGTNMLYYFLNGDEIALKRIWFDKGTGKLQTMTYSTKTTKNGKVYVPERLDAEGDSKLTFSSKLSQKEISTIHYFLNNRFGMSLFPENVVKNLPKKPSRYSGNEPKTGDDGKGISDDVRAEIEKNARKGYVSSDKLEEMVNQKVKDALSGNVKDIKKRIKDGLEDKYKDYVSPEDAKKLAEDAANAARKQAEDEYKGHVSPDKLGDIVDKALNNKLGDIQDKARTDYVSKEEAKKLAEEAANAARKQAEDEYKGYVPPEKIGDIVNKALNEKLEDIQNQARKGYISDEQAKKLAEEAAKNAKKEVPDDVRAEIEKNARKGYISPDKLGDIVNKALNDKLGDIQDNARTDYISKEEAKKLAEDAANAARKEAEDKYKGHVSPDKLGDIVNKALNDKLGDIQDQARKGYISNEKAKKLADAAKKEARKGYISKEEADKLIKTAAEDAAKPGVSKEDIEKAVEDAINKYITSKDDKTENINQKDEGKDENELNKSEDEYASPDLEKVVEASKVTFMKQELESNINTYEKQRLAYEEEYLDLPKGGSRFNLKRKFNRGKKLRGATKNYKKRLVTEAKLLKLTKSEDASNDAMSQIPEKIRQYKNALANGKVKPKDQEISVKDVKVVFEDNKDPSKGKIRIVNTELPEGRKEITDIINQEKPVSESLKKSYLGLRTVVDETNSGYDIRANRDGLEAWLSKKLNIDEKANFRAAVDDYVSKHFVTDNTRLKAEKPKKVKIGRDKRGKRSKSRKISKSQNSWEDMKAKIDDHFWVEDNYHKHDITDRVLPEFFEQTKTLANKETLNASALWYTLDKFEAQKGRRFGFFEHIGRFFRNHNPVTDLFHDLPEAIRHRNISKEFDPKQGDKVLDDMINDIFKGIKSNRGDGTTSGQDTGRAFGEAGEGVAGGILLLEVVGGIGGSSGSGGGGIIPGNDGGIVDVVTEAF